MANDPKNHPKSARENRYLIAFAELEEGALRLLLTALVSACNTNQSLIKAIHPAHLLYASCRLEFLAWISATYQARNAEAYSNERHEGGFAEFGVGRSGHGASLPRTSALDKGPEAPAAAKGFPDATQEALMALHTLPSVDAGGQQLTAAQVLGGMPVALGAASR